MPLILKNSVFLMIPRTATTWARQAMHNAGMKYWESNPKHATEVVQRIERPLHVPSFCFTFTRNPDSWLRSRWTLGKWEDDFSDLWNIDYDVFRSSVSNAMVEMYFKKYTSKCKFVGRTENIADDLVTALQMAGEDFDELTLRETKPINESPKDGDLILEAYWLMKRMDLGQIPQEMIARLPVQLLNRLPPNQLNSLPPKTLVAMLERTTQDALQSAGAATRGGRGV